MTQSIHKTATRIGVFLVLVGFAAATFTATPAEAQLNVYRLEGVIYGPTYQPLPGASITLYTMAGAKQASATSDANGKYALANLPSGKYNLSVSDACCPTFWVPIEISGTDPTVQQNVVLGSNAGKGPLVLRGVAKEEATGKPLANVRIELWNHPQVDEDRAKMSSYPYRESQQSSISGADGAYSFNVEAGMISLNARLEGYDVLHTNFQMSGARTLDLPMRQSSGGVVTVSGVVKSSDGKPLSNAYVNVHPDYECKGDVCTAEAYPENGSNSRSGDVEFWYQPSNQPYASTQTDANGKYTLQTTPGARIVTAMAEDHLEARSKFTGSDGETEKIDLSLERMPADSVRVSGKVVDAKTGKAVPHAQVNLENQRWGHYNHTMTKEDGTFSFNTKPGHTLVTVTADQHYWVPCYEGSTSDRAVAPGERYPCADGGQRTREQAYFSRVIVLAGEDASYQLDVSLEPRPAPTAELKGYVVNASSQKGVAGVVVQVFNEFTHDWGTATTDQDGSFRIKVHAGYYTLRASAEHYFDGVSQIQAKDGESLRVDVELTPGEKRYGGGGCCWTYASMGRAAPAGVGKADSQTMSAGYETAPMMSESRSMDMDSGAESYKGEAGGLGPYKPFTGNDGERSGGTAPGAGLAALVAGLAVAMVLRRRNH